jgi:hypothetical protein
MRPGPQMIFIDDGLFLPEDSRGKVFNPTGAGDSFNVDFR